jgi:hypothetical protein
MALIVEDGTAKTDAESYIGVTDANTYHANRGNTTWTALTDEQCEQALRKATDYMTQVYRLRWKGYRVTATQALDWPRSMVERPDFAYTSVNGYTTIDGMYYFPSDEVPVEVQRACAELALIASTTDLNPSISRRTIREKVDVIEVEYDPHSPLYTQFRAIDGMLAPFLTSVSGAFRKVVRT